MWKSNSPKVKHSIGYGLENSINFIYILKLIKYWECIFKHPYHWFDKWMLTTNIRKTFPAFIYIFDTMLRYALDFFIFSIKSILLPSFLDILDNENMVPCETLSSHENIYVEITWRSCKSCIYLRIDNFLLQSIEWRLSDMRRRKNNI